MFDPRTPPFTCEADAREAARKVQTPGDAREFEELAGETKAGREFLVSQEWVSYRRVIDDLSRQRRPVGITFSEALHIVRAGGHIARASWPEGSYVMVQAGYPDGIPITPTFAAATGLRPGSAAVLGPHLLRRLAPGLAQPPTFEVWTPGQGDLFADDWCAVGTGAV